MTALYVPHNLTFFLGGGGAGDSPPSATLGKAPTSQKSLLGPKGPKCPGECPTGCPRKWGCARECLSGCLRGLRSVKKVSRECQKGVLTLRGHSGDTSWTLRSPRRHPEGHSLGHPHFRGHPVGHSPGHFGPEGPERLFWLVGAFAKLPSARRKLDPLKVAYRLN